MKLEIYPEICCDYCDSVIHNHFECPTCKYGYAGTSYYGDMYDMEINDEFSCEECESRFRLISREPYGIHNWEWKQTKVGQ